MHINGLGSLWGISDGLKVEFTITTFDFYLLSCKYDYNKLYIYILL
jgi:hypothetical protein